MSSPEAYDVIHDYLTATWTQTPITFENDGVQLPDDPEYWVQVEIFGSFYEQASIGADPAPTNVWRESGTILAHVLIPLGKGTRQGRVYAMMIADLFRGQDIAGVEFGDASIGAGEAADSDGAYFRMTVTIDWQRDD